MTIALNVLLLVLCLTIAAIASDHAVDRARALATSLSTSPFVIGVAIVAVGTDMPEIANSISAHLQGRGDINVGDSVGSILTQFTLVLATLGLLARRVQVNRREILFVGGLTLPGLGALILFVDDNWFTRWEGAVLIGLWVVFLGVIVRALPHRLNDDPGPDVTHRATHLLSTQLIVLLAIIAVSATVAVSALIRVADGTGVPEFLVAYFGEALGTSAPELVVVISAVRRGAHALALGDAVGASFVDSTLSLGIGALIAPAAVTARLAIPGIAYALVAVAAVSLLLAARRRHDRFSAAVLLALYAAAYVVVIAADT